MLAEVESLRKSLNIYKGLVEVSGLINSITDYDELLRAILDVARRVILAEAASLFFVNKENGALELAISSFAEGQFHEPKISVPSGRGIAGWVATHAQSLLIPRAYEDSRFYKEADRQTGFRTRSILCAPLIYAGGVIGVLQILNPRDKESFDEQDLEGFAAYANLTATAIEKLRALERMRAQERVERDLAIACDIQRELLARAIPVRIPGAVFAAHNQAASNVGGDFYNVFVRSPYEIYFAIGDVSGKGIAASLLMAQTLSAMQFVFASTASPSEALTKLNSTLNERIVRGMFVTTIVGRIVPSADRVELASAGHCKPIIIRADGSVREIETDGSLPLGIIPKVNYRQGKLDLHPGDWLVCFTDGLTESRNPDDDTFFEPKIIPALSERKFLSPQNIVDHLIDCERRYRGAGRQSDDLTILAGRLGVKSKFVFTSESCRMAEVRHSARTFLKQCHFDESSIELLVLGLDEACTNIIRHAYDHHERPVRLEMERLRDRVRFVLRDYGRSCDPKCIRSRELADVRPGGVGVYIIRQVFDYVNYEPRRRGTRLILEKKFARPEVVSNGGH